MHNDSNMLLLLQQVTPKFRSASARPIIAGLKIGIGGLKIGLAAALLSAVTGCGAPASVMLRINGTPDDALVTLNDRYVDKLGRIKKRGIKLNPGEYRLTVEQVGYFPHDELVRVKKDQPNSVNVELQRIPE